MSDDHNTPSWIKQIFEGWYDPCYISDGRLRPFDGLGDWKEKTFVNPPYSDPLPWVMRGIEHNKNGNTVAFILRLDCYTKYWKLLQEAGAHFIFPNERVSFNGKSPNFCVMIAILEGVKNE